MLFALIATDQDTERFSQELQAVLSSLPTATVVQAPTSQPAPAQAATTTTSQPSQGTDAAAGARFARSQYAAFAKIAGRKPNDAEKAQLKAGASPADVAGSQPAEPETTPSVDVEALLAEMRAKLTGQPASQPASQPTPQPATSAKRVKFDSIPPSAQLPQAVCNELQVWAQSLTGDMATGRKGAVVAYATGQPNGVQRVMDAYGAKLPKFLSKLNSLVNA